MNHDQIRGRVYGFTLSGSGRSFYKERINVEFYQIPDIQLSDDPVPDLSLLASWDISKIPSGWITLRLHMEGKNDGYAQKHLKINLQVPTPTPTPTATPTLTATPTPTITISPTITITPSMTPSPTDTSTPTPTVIPPP